LLRASRNAVFPLRDVQRLRRIGWVVLMTSAGYFLGGIPFIQRHFEKVVIAIVLISVLPVVFEILKSRRRSSAAVVIPE
jgi:membrane protein DedA with SNARE-associated domain